MAERRVMKPGAVAAPAVHTSAQRTSAAASPFGPRKPKLITRPIGQRGVGATRNADGSATRTVTVACKIPNGLLLRTFHPVQEKEQTPNGVRDMIVHHPDPEVFHVHGPAMPFGKMPEGFSIEGGFALTRGIPEAFWQKWAEQNTDFDAFKNGLIFACKTASETAQEARGMRKIKSGLEPIDPDNLPPEFKKIKTSTNKDDAEMRE